MKTKLLHFLYSVVAFLADKTKGFPLFSKWKIALGSLLVGIAIISCKQKTASVEILPVEPEKDTITETTCYKQIVCETDMTKSSETKRLKSTPAIIVKDSGISASESIVKWDKKPEYPGGEDALAAFLSDIQYPSVAINYGITGRVDIQFRIEKEGNITNIEILKDVGGHCGAEVVRRLKSMPKWLKGNSYGLYKLSVYFVFEEDTIKIPEPLPNDTIIQINSIVIRVQTPIIKISDIACYSVALVPSPDYVRDTADVMPRFSRSEKSMQKYIKKHYKRPLGADTVSGVIIVRAVIDWKGYVCQPEIIEGIRPDLDTAALDLVRQMPKWKPAKQYGEPVSCYVNISIHIDVK